MGRRPSHAAATIAVTAVVVAAASLGLPDPPPARGANPRPPNVILIVADDMRWDEVPVRNRLRESFPASYLPAIRDRLIERGFAATNMFVVNSLCCPSRASILTGNYSHTTGVWNNENTPTGGVQAFRDDEGSTLATWFDAAGYRTALVGKYMNNYAATTVGHIPAGWDRWVAYRQGENIGYYDYSLNVQGTAVSYGSAPKDYATDVLARYAADIIDGTRASRPLFLYFAPYTPHEPWTPARRHADLFTSYRPRLPPNVAEADMSDKPSWARALPMTGTNWYRTKRTQMQMLMALDDAVDLMLDALRRAGRLRTTYIIFTADNGLSGGSHRWTNKKSAWDEALRVPLIVRGPGIPRGAVRSGLITNIDIADTLEALTGVPMPRTDGVSAAPMIRGTGRSRRTEFAFERLGDATNPPSYCGVRTKRYKYIRYQNGEVELYDLRADPWEMSSRHADPAYDGLERTLRARAVDLCSPTIPGYSF